MVRPPISDVLKGRISALLDLNYSNYMVSKTLKKQGYNVSPSTVSRVKTGSHRQQKSNTTTTPVTPKRGQLKVLNQRKLNQLKEMVFTPDPPTQRHMSKK